MAEGTREIIVLNRSAERAADMLAHLRAGESSATMTHAPLTAEAFAEHAAQAGLVVNCTAGGARHTIDALSRQHSVRTPAGWTSTTGMPSHPRRTHAAQRAYASRPATACSLIRRRTDSFCSPVSAVMAMNSWD